MVAPFERAALVFLAGATVATAMASVTAPVPRGPAPEASASRQAASSSSLAEAHAAAKAANLHYDLEAVAAGAPVPRVLATAILGTDASGEDVLRAMLPGVLLANEEVLAEREQLWGIRFRRGRGERLPPEQRLWLEVIADRYAVADDNLDELMGRVDVVPPSMVLAAASEALRRERRESSERQRNADAGRGKKGPDSPDVAPARKRVPTDSSKRSEAARSPLAHARALIRMFNTESEYGNFRRERALLRQAAAPLDGLRLASALPKARNGQMRSDRISDLIIAQRLTRFDRARLEPSRPAG